MSTIRRCLPEERPAILAIVNAAAERYRGVIPADCWHEPYMIRHAYVRPDRQGRGVGGDLLRHLEAMSRRPILIGTWADAAWAIRFYESHDYVLVPSSEAARLLRLHWTVSPRQVETSVVLAKTRLTR